MIQHYVIKDHIRPPFTHVQIPVTIGPVVPDRSTQDRIIARGEQPMEYLGDAGVVGDVPTRDDKLGAVHPYNEILGKPETADARL